jgi:hypothetical protein
VLIGTSWALLGIQAQFTTARVFDVQSNLPRDLWPKFRLRV